MLWSSVACRISWHTEIYWAVRKWIILNKREFSDLSSSILNSLLLLIEVYYFNMNRKETKLNGLLVIRFASIIFLFRLAAIPVKVKKISTKYFVYMTTMIICSCSTLTGMFLDVYIHWDDLGSVTKTLRVLIPLTNFMWIFSNCRWVRTMVVISAVS